MSPPPERSLYLYFLDRELGDAVGYSLDPAVARRALQALLIATNSRLFCGISLLYENSNLDDVILRFLGGLIEVGALDVVSHHPSFDEFMASRMELYGHDRSRYPAYFSGLDLPRIQPTVQKAGGTTAKIVTGMTEWALRAPGVAAGHDAQAQLRTLVLRALSERDERALTFSLFRPYLKDLADSAVIEGNVRRAISRLYASDYRDFGDNDIPTGLRGLAYFEQELARGFPYADVPVLTVILRRSGIDLSHPAYQSGPIWESLINSRGSDGHFLLAGTIRWLVAGFAEVVLEPHLASRQDEVRIRVLDLLHRLTSPQYISPWPSSGGDCYSIAAANAGILARQLSEDHRFAEALARLHDSFLPPARADVLLVVATDVESEGVIGIFAENGHQLADVSFSATNAYHVFTPIAGTRVALARCSMGAGGPGGPELTVAEAIGVLRPSSVIMVGIAFGINSDKARLGDVLVSSQVFDYELARIGTDAMGRAVSVSRGARPEASMRLVSNFRLARLQTSGLRVREGVILSGRKLVDNVDYRDTLLAMCPEAIGGEMEGHGIYSAAVRAKADWIIVKSICDWADGAKRTRKSSRQHMAARNAALAVLRTIELGGLAH